jgi:hypothetical protein
MTGIIIIAVLVVLLVRWALRDTRHTTGRTTRR